MGQVQGQQTRQAHRADRRPVGVPGQGLLGRVVELAGGAIGAAAGPHEEGAARLPGPHGVIGAELGEGRVVELAGLGPVALPGALVEAADGLAWPERKSGWCWRGRLGHRAAAAPIGAAVERRRQRGRQILP